MRIEPSTCTLEVAKSGALTYYAMGATNIVPGYDRMFAGPIGRDIINISRFDVEELDL